MSTTTDPVPGAVITIKLSSAAIARAEPLFKKTLIADSLSDYKVNLEDGSTIIIKTGAPFDSTQETSLLAALANPNFWQGDDSIRLILPNDLTMPLIVTTGEGNDKVTAQGGGGEMMIDTGAGDDQIVLLDEQPHVTTGAGTDSLRSRLDSIDLYRYSGLENFIFTGTTEVLVQGNDLANQITGGSRADEIWGDLGDDSLIGLAGNDSLYGGLGHDQLFGGTGNDVLAGGDGTDSLYGGAGNDLYIIDADDVVNESRSPTDAADAGGIDTVEAFSNSTLGAYVENLRLTGEAIFGRGNALANTLTGNERDNALEGESGNDQLWGGFGNDRLNGGEGADALWGGSGNDLYLVDHARDRVAEAVSASDASDAGGYDTVESTVSFNLTPGLEVLILRGEANISGAGNSADELIIGNSGDNLIDGKGGVDSLNGGNGSDIYLIASPDEHRGAEISDQGSVGIDEVRFSPTAAKPIAGSQAASPTLTLFKDDVGIERVVVGTGTGKLAVITGKVAADVNATEVGNALTIIGNNGSNVLTGTAYDDILIGNGGNDVLIGGAGKDQFVFNRSPRAKTELETLRDFHSGEDQLVFLRSAFAGIGAAGDLTKSALYSGNGAVTAHDADDRFIFDSQNGQLYYDRDGTGSAAATLIGIFTPGTELSARDIKIVEVV